MGLISKKAVEAKRVGTSLVAAFHKANPPLVWRFDLERNHSFSLALQGTAGDWQLGLTTPTGEFQTVARFAERADAELAFTETEKVLAQGKPTATGILLKLFGVVALIFVGIIVFGYITEQNLLVKQHTVKSTAIVPAMPTAKPVVKPGVPLPADDFLVPPQ